MTSLPEKLMAIIAPNTCISCSNYNNILCDQCLLQIPAYEGELCFSCDLPCSTSGVCKKCKTESGVKQAFIGVSYEGAPAQAIKRLKFERAKSAALPLAKILCNQLPVLPEGMLIVPVPTTPSRARQRGYDQSVLIAKHVGKMQKRPVACVVGRDSSVRQLGASKQTRLEQIKGAFYCKNAKMVKGKQILLLDDVVTTGATLKTAAKILYANGAERVYVAAVAKTPPASVKQ